MNRDERTKAHQTIRELFKGTFETAARDVAGEEGQRIAITWSRSGGQTRRVDKRKGESCQANDFNGSLMLTCDRGIGQA